MAVNEDQTVRVSQADDASRYEIEFEGALAGFTHYRLEGSVIDFDHTEIDPAFGGRGLGTKLIEFAVTDARSKNLEIVASCPFVRKWIEDNPEAV